MLLNNIDLIRLYLLILRLLKQFRQLLSYNYQCIQHTDIQVYFFYYFFGQIANYKINFLLLFIFIFKPMLQASQFHHHQNQTPQCCVFDFFSKKSEKIQHHQRNSNGLVNPYNISSKNLLQKQAVLQNLKFKNQTPGIKRSISALKVKRRTTIRANQETQSTVQHPRMSQDNLKFNNPFSEAQVLQKFYSPRAQYSHQMSYSSYEDRKTGVNLNNLSYVHQNKIIYPQKLKTNPIFNQLNKINEIKFSKASRPQIAQTGSYQSVNQPKKNIETNFKSLNQIQTVDKNNIKNNPQTTGKDLKNSINKVNNNQRSIQLTKQFAKKQSLKNSIAVTIPGLIKIQQASKQQTLRSGYLEEPVNPFQHIQSYIVSVSKPKQNDSQQNQYDSIKTKGRPVESVISVSKDLARTKKSKRRAAQFGQGGLRQLDNITVTSEYDQGWEQQKRLVIQQSAVMMNFFDPPAHMRDRLLLSRSKKTGFY